MDASQITRANPPREQGFRLELDPKVMAMLVLLTRHQGQIVSRDELLARLRPHRAIIETFADASKPGDTRAFKIAVAIGAATALFFMVLSLGVG